MKHQDIKEKYPHWYNEEGEYVQGALENEIQRTKETILDAENEVLIYGGTSTDIAGLRAQLKELTEVMKEQQRNGSTPASSRNITILS